MTDQTADTPVRRPSRLINAIKSIGLLRESIVGTVGAGICVFWIVVALLAPVLAPYPPNQQIAPMLFATPGSEIPPGTMIAIAGGEMVEATGSYILGGDNLGRDVLSRVIWGARTVLIFAPLATFCAYVAGILMGLAAGYKRGWIDDVLSRISDIIGLLPPIFEVRPQPFHDILVLTQPV